MTTNSAIGVTLHVNKIKNSTKYKYF